MRFFKTVIQYIVDSVMDNTDNFASFGFGLAVGCVAMIVSLNYDDFGPIHYAGVVRASNSGEVDNLAKELVKVRHEKFLMGQDLEIMVESAKMSRDHEYVALERSMRLEAAMKRFVDDETIRNTRFVEMVGNLSDSSVAVTTAIKPRTQTPAE